MSGPPVNFSMGSLNSLNTKDGYGLKERSWEAVQQKTFTKWVNMKLKPHGIPAVEDLTKSFQDGVALIQLLEIIGDESLGKYNKNPKMRLHRVENLNKALEFIKSRNVNLTNIGAEDIVDGNNKLVLGMIWTIILRFTIAEISEGDLSAKEGLLLWCQRKTQGYKDVNVKDFTFSFQDGLAFCALIHRHRPDLLDFSKLNKNDRAQNLALAFDVAEKHLNIPKLLDVEDIIDVAKPDERSIMTYVAQYFHAFSAANKLETAGRRVRKFVNVVASIYEMQHDFESRVKALLQNITGTIHSWESNRVSTDYTGAHEQLLSLQQFKSNEKRTWASEKRELDGLLGNIQTKLKTFNLRPYSPPEGCHLSDLEAKWNELVSNQSSRRRDLTNSIKEIKERLRHKFADLANDFMHRLNGVAASLAAVGGDLKDQLESVKTLSAKISSFDSDVQALRRAENECNQAKIEDNEYTVYDTDDLIYELGLVKLNMQKKSGFIENQIVASSMSSLTPEQLIQFEETFHHFDKDNSNDLSDHEFKAALAGLDIYIQDDGEFKALFSKVAQGGSLVTFQQFVNYMVSITEDQTTAEQIREAFKALSGGKSILTRVELQIGQVPIETIEFVEKNFANSDGKIDYNELIGKVF